MNCPKCGSHHTRKNEIKRGKQNHIFCNCRRQFIQDYEPSKTYSNEIKEECIRMYLNGIGFRAIERVKGVHHTTIIAWVKQLSRNLPDAPPIEEILEVGELDELETFVCSKKQNLAMDSSKSFSILVFWLGCWEIIVQKLLSLYGR